MEEITTIGTLVLGTMGFWKVIELAFKTFTEKRYKKAQTRHLILEGNSVLIENYAQWAETLQEKVNALEAKATMMHEEALTLQVTIEEQKKLIQEQFEQIATQNAQLEAQASQIAQLLEVNQKLQQQITANYPAHGK